MKRKFTFLLIIFLITGALIQCDSGSKVEVDDSRVDYKKLAKKAEKLNEKEKYQQVIDLLEPYSEDEENESPFFFNELGMAFYLKKDYVNAIKYYEITRKLDKNDAKTLYNLAGAHTLLENYDEALKFFDMAESKGFDKKFIEEWRVWIKEKK